VAQTKLGDDCQVQSEGALESLERRAAVRGIDLESLSADTAVDLVLGWFRDDRVDDARPLDQDGDGILFQWGTYDFFNDGPTFQYDLTRQMALSEGAEVRLLHLSVTLHYTATPGTTALGSGEEWCFSPESIPQLRRVIELSPATAYASTRRPTKVTLDLSEV
jgi:hypothetical protein